MDDLISRQAAIDALGKAPKYKQKIIKTYAEGRNDQWFDDVAALVKLPSAQPQSTMGQANEAAQSTNDCISRQAAIDALERVKTATSENGERWIAKINAQMELEQMPSARPEIIRCRECKFASGDSRICMKFGHSPIGELDFCAWAERRTDE